MAEPKKSDNIDITKVVKNLVRGAAETVENYKLTGFVNEKFYTAKQLRRIFEIRWYITRAFYRGEHYVFWNKGTGLLERHRSINRLRTRIADPQLLPRVRKQQAKLLRLRPRAEVIPNTDSADDRDAANLGTDLLKHLHRILKGDKVCREVANWITTTGNAFAIDRWSEENDEVEIEVDPPFAYYVPTMSFGADELEDMPWVIRAKLRTTDWIKDKYGKEVSPESTSADQNILMLMRDLDSGTGALETVYNPSAIVKEVWIKPCPNWKKGIYFVECGGNILYKGKFPNYGSDAKPIYQYPITHFRDIKIPGQFWGQATMEQAIPLQQDWNAIRSSIIEWVRLMAKGKWLAPKGAGLQPTAIDDQHGEVIEFNIGACRGFPPQQGRIIPLPQAVFQALETNKNSLMDLFAQHEPTMGTVRSDIRSASMLAMLMEQDDSTQAMTYHDFEDNWALLWKHVLVIVQKHYTTSRTLKVVGVGKDNVVRTFKGSDLKNNTDVFVATGTHMPENRLARQAVIMERFQQGLYGDPRDPSTARKVRRMLEDTVETDVYDDITPDQEVAKEENRMLRAGIPVRTNTFDNHQIHMTEHDRELKSPEVMQNLRRNDPQIITAFVQHIQEHAMRLAQGQQQMMMSMGPPGGIPGQMPGIPPPGMPGPPGAPPMMGAPNQPLGMPPPQGGMR